MPTPAETGRTPPPDAGLVPLVYAHPDDRPTVITAPPPSDGVLPAPGDPGVPVGSSLGGFQVTGSVGAGGMAAVLKAVDTELGREVALKILPQAMTRDADAVARFKHEARAAARLDHDNIARVFACGEDRGRHFIAFEFVAGENLRALIDARGPLPAAECVGYMLQVSAGLAHASSRGVVHRDIKPSNLVVTPQGRCKIVDMGLARNLDAPANGGVTQSGMTLGTFDYISPEQALDPRRADVRSDIYSLGCAFYHALTGRPPVPEGTAAKKLSAHQNDPVLDPRVLNPLVPDCLARVLARMMAKDVAKRYQTPQDLSAALVGVAHELGLTGESLALDPALLAPPLRPADGPAVSAAVVAGLAALAAAAVVAVSVLGGPASNGNGGTRPPFDADPPRPQTLVTVPDAPAIVPPASPAVLPARTVGTAEQLVQVLSDPAVTDITLEPGTYDLAKLPAVPVARGTRLTLTGASATDPPVVRVRAGPADGSPAERASLVVPRGAVTFRGLTVTVVGPADVGSSARPAGIIVSDAAAVEVSACRFATDRVGPAGPDAAALLVGRAGPDWGTLTVKHCVFLPRRGVGLAIVGRVRAGVSECGFGAHAAAVILDPPDADPAALPALDLRSCTFALDPGGAAVEASGPAGVTHAFCVFATPEPDPTEMMKTDPNDRPPHAVRSTRDAPDAAKVLSRSGEPSLLYRVEPAGTPTDPVITAPNARLAGDAGVTETTTSPWAADPVAALAGPDPWQAFRLRTTLPAVRTPAGPRVLGAVELPRPGVRLYPYWPPAAADAGSGRTRTVVPDANAVPDLRANQHRTLAAAVAAARPDDTIEIRHDGSLPSGPLVLTDPQANLTIRAAPGTRPVLTLTEPGAELFRLAAGALTLDGVDLRVAGSAAAVTVGPARGLTLKNCTITLAGPDPTDRAAAVRLDDAAGPAGPAVTIAVEQAIVRGAGSLLRASAGRAFTLDAKHAVLALAGAAVDVRTPIARAAGTGAVRMAHVTALLGGSLVRLDASTGPLLSIIAGKCLFVPLADGPVLVVRNAPAAGLTGALTWKTDAPNAYASNPTRTAWATVTGPSGGASPVTAAAFFALVGEDPADAAGRVTVSPMPGDLAAFDAAGLTVAAPDVPNAAGAGAVLMARPGVR